MKRHWAIKYSAENYINVETAWQMYQNAYQIALYFISDASKKASGKWGGSVYRCLSDLLTAQALIITFLSWREKIPLFSFIPRTSAWHDWFRRTESISESLEGEETAQVHSESRLHIIHTPWKLLTERSRLPNICIRRILQ